MRCEVNRAIDMADFQGQPKQQREGKRKPPDCRVVWHIDTATVTIFAKKKRERKNCKKLNVKRFGSKSVCSIENAKRNLAILFKARANRKTNYVNYHFMICRFPRKKNHFEKKQTNMEIIQRQRDTEPNMAWACL